jgi:queuine tRNA-ribosyltransferase
MLETLAATLPLLPPDQPRYLMGLGDPIGMVEAVALGIDLFDCVLPTRFGRHGSILSNAGRYNLKRAENANADAPLDGECGCPVCARWSRAYLRHLLVVDEPTAPRLMTIHNVWWTLRLVEELRAAVEAGSLDGVRSRITAAYG